MIAFDTRGKYSNSEGVTNITTGNIFYGTEGYMEYGKSWKAFRKWEKEPFAGEGIGDRKVLAEPGPNTFANFIEAIRAGNDDGLINPVASGHYSTALPHLANISYRLGRRLNFNGTEEKFVNDPEATAMLTRKEYRKPYVVPDKV